MQDKGQNAKLNFSFLTDTDKFAINGTSGVITSTESLQTYDGQMFHLEVLVTDGGAGGFSSTGLVEIKVIIEVFKYIWVTQ